MVQNQPTLRNLWPLKGDQNWSSSFGTRGKGIGMGAPALESEERKLEWELQRRNRRERNWNWHGQFQFREAQMATCCTLSFRSRLTPPLGCYTFVGRSIHKRAIMFLCMYVCMLRKTGKPIMNPPTAKKHLALCKAKCKFLSTKSTFSSSLLTL
jgi:hypothetical protein